MARFDLTERAQADLAGIAAYTAQQWGPAQAGRYLEALELRLLQLAARPTLGTRREDIAECLLSFPAESHIVYFVPTGAGIVVLRILHKRQDPHRHV